MKVLLKPTTICLLFLTLFIVSCNTEEDFTTNSSNKININIQNKNFYDLLQNKNFKTCYSEVAEQSVTRVNAKSALEEEYNFTIVDSKPVKVITDENTGEVTYIMLIEREVVEDLKFENLLIKTVNDSLIEADILKYTLAGYGEKEYLHDSYMLDVADVEYTNLKMAVPQYTGTGPCRTIMTLMCDDIAGGEYPHNHIAGPECIDGSNNLYYTYTIECDENLGGTEGASTANSGSNIGSTTTGSSGTVITSPIPDDNSIITSRHCETLTSLISNANPTVLPAINTVNTEANSDDRKEFGASFVVNSNGTIVASPITNSSGGTYYDAIDIPTGPNIVGAVHSHPTNNVQSSTLPIFSFADLLVLYRLDKDADYENLNNVVFMLTSPNHPTYAIKISDRSSFINYLRNFVAGVDLSSCDNNVQKSIALSEEFDKRLRKGGDNECIRNFLKETKDAGINLFELGAGNEWYKVSLPPRTYDNLNKTKC